MFIEVIQEQVEYEEYHFPLEIAIQYEKETKYQTFYIDKKSMQFRIESKQSPEDIIIDPNNWLLISADQK